jgi:hypothetical protein
MAMQSYPVRRWELDDQVTVTVEGTFPDPDALARRPMARVVLEMPDHAAATLGNLINATCCLLAALGPIIGDDVAQLTLPTERELAAALLDASRTQPGTRLQLARAPEGDGGRSQPPTQKRGEV